MIRLDQIFTVSYGHSLELDRQERDPHGVCFVSRTEKCNGVSDRIAAIEGSEPSPAGSISVALGGSVLATFVQPEPFYSGRDIAVLAPKNSGMAEIEKLWWAWIIRSNRYRYSYGRQANRTLSALELPDTVPDWVYTTPIPDVSALTAAASGPVAFTDPSTWGEFRLDGLFDVSKGAYVKGSSDDSGTTPRVSSTATSNGHGGTTTQDANFKGGTITVARNGSIGEAFYQPIDFFATDDVHVFEPGAGANKYSPEASLFIATVIRQEKPRYNYGRKWGLDKMRETIVRLPQTTEGAPDWAYMESYIRGLAMSSVFSAEAADATTAVRHTGAPSLG